MDGKKVFTINKKDYDGLPNFAKILQERGLKYVIIMVRANTYSVA